MDNNLHGLESVVYRTLDRLLKGESETNLKDTQEK